MLCDHLEGWDREGGRKMQEGGVYGDICIRIADSLCDTAESNTPFLSNYTAINMSKRKERSRFGNYEVSLGCVKLRSG